MSLRISAGTVDHDFAASAQGRSAASSWAGAQRPSARNLAPIPDMFGEAAGTAAR
jgi:hypothetical protein